MYVVCVVFSCLHVTSVAHASVAGLRSALVESHLKVYLALAGTQLILGERALVLFGHLGAQGWSIVFGMLLRLFRRNTKHHFETSPGLDQNR